MDENGRLFQVGDMQLTADDAEQLLCIIQQRFKGAWGSALAQLGTGVEYTVKAPAKRRQ